MTPDQEKRLLDFVDRSLVWHGRVDERLEGLHGYIKGVSDNGKKISDRLDGHLEEHREAAQEEVKEEKANSRDGAWRLATLIIAFFSLLLGAAAFLGIGRLPAPAAAATRVSR